MRYAPRRCGMRPSCARSRSPFLRHYARERAHQRRLLFTTPHAPPLALHSSLRERRRDGGCVRLSTTLRAVTPIALEGQSARQRSASSGVPPTASPGRSSRAVFPPRGTLRKHGTATALGRCSAPQRVVRETSPVQAGHSECPGSARLAPGKPRQEAGQLPVPLARVAPPGVATLLSKHTIHIARRPGNAPAVPYVNRRHIPCPQIPTGRAGHRVRLRRPRSPALPTQTRSPRGRSTFIKTHPSAAPLQAVFGRDGLTRRTVATLPPNAAGGPDKAVSPLSFPPLESPFPDPPFQIEHGQRGNTAGGTSPAAFSGASDRRGSQSHAGRAPPPFGLPDATPPLCPLAPRPPMDRARSSVRHRLRPFRSSHGVGPPRCSLRSPDPSIPPCATTPQGVGRVRFGSARRPRASERLQNKAGCSPGPSFGSARKSRRPAKKPHHHGRRWSPVRCLHPACVRKEIQTPWLCPQRPAPCEAPWCEAPLGTRFALRKRPETTG